ncbi:chromosomal replication initiation protein DnaA [endosymbiont 'TC1' of Trimyema compressum]|uniref:chromosomal replication initiator protein DnaA n=1 Tax=endosymbiont 'TC1' of Trimyema compressum TaxID=243899 RepID=UPI0007F124D3|nr:chromosomal replication initiator protein DnaA [endosymbiont 'TC1' of Trimyema compressum]AMP19768.1 chromosomal replication initiation protein DnaA [endosymbiont 'TC1' of Trimyema compressum]
MSLESINTQFLKLLRKNVKNDSTYNAWFKDATIISINTTNAVIAVPNSFTKKLLMKTYFELINNTINSLCNSILSVDFVENQSDVYNSIINKSTKKPKEANLSTNNLNPKYTFEGFIIGENNRFAHAACLAAAETPAKIYNPIFIYGGVGLGKTHLMHAMGHHYLSSNSKANVLYVSTETFTNELINAIQKGKIDAFRDKYRNIDFLLIDDIQFLENKEKTQDEFFHTFNTLKDANKQIVISSDEAPNKLKIEERLTSRFAWGLLTDISQPDFETRVAILKKKASLDDIELPEETYHLIAQKITSNIRELEGALLRVDAYVTLNNMQRDDITEEFIQSILKDIANNQIHMRITDDTIKKTVATFYGIREEDLNSKRRSRNIAFPRQIAMYLIRELTELSLPKIGKCFGGKDHTTVIHACDKIAISMATNPEVKQVVNQIKESLETGKF